MYAHDRGLFNPITLCENLHLLSHFGLFLFRFLWTHLMVTPKCMYFIVIDNFNIVFNYLFICVVVRDWMSIYSAQQGNPSHPPAWGPIPLSPGKDISSVVALASSEPFPFSVSKRTRSSSRKVLTSQEVPLPSRGDSQCKTTKRWKANSRAAPKVNLDPENTNEYPVGLFCKKHPSIDTVKALSSIPLEEKLTRASESFFEVLTPPYSMCFNSCFPYHIITLNTHILVVRATLHKLSQ